MNGNGPATKYLYWLGPEAFDSVKRHLIDQEYNFEKAKSVPCQVLKCHEDTLTYAPPEIWSKRCKRQGSWYRESKRAGRYMIMSARRLPEETDRYLDAEVSISDFVPESLPSDRELQMLVQSSAYQNHKPDEWERISWKDSLGFKVFFTLWRFWGWDDNLRKHWLGHRANHANFLSKTYTTEIDGEHVAYSVTENAGVCSSCVEFFNVVDDESRKLVRACPGSVTFGGAQRDVYYDVNPVRARYIKKKR